MYRNFEGAVRGAVAGAVRGAVVQLPPLYRERPNAISKGRYGAVKGITRGGARPNALLVGSTTRLQRKPQNLRNCTTGAVYLQIVNAERNITID